MFSVVIVIFLFKNHSVLDAKSVSGNSLNANKEAIAT